MTRRRTHRATCLEVVTKLLLFLCVLLLYIYVSGDCVTCKWRYPPFVTILNRVAEVPLPSRQALCSAGTERGRPPDGADCHTFKCIVFDRTFSATTPCSWNSLPDHVYPAELLSSFRLLLKKFLFQQSFSNIVLCVLLMF